VPEVTTLAVAPPDSARARRNRIISIIGASSVVLLIVLATIMAFWPSRAGSSATPLILITLTGTANHTFNGGESYTLSVTWIESGVSAKCIQLHLGGSDGAPIPLPFDANLTRSEGPTYAQYNSSDSAWDGSGASDALCSDGGWLTGASSQVQIGDSLALVVPVAHSGAGLLVGVSTAEGDSESWFALIGEIYPFA
jgi:hypothetical protein